MDAPFAVFLNIFYSHVCTGNLFVTWCAIKRMWIVIIGQSTNFTLQTIFALFAAGSAEDAILRSDLLENLSYLA